ncbi:hypothetical protein [Leifsonia aquatica]|uniref:hypothetical protein n=1 Tax=Leifsonia aquatica TaxID=144185 RepID=UPI00046A76B6|nr:hypothetical protein [Leifsonia aquatica]
MDKEQAIDEAGRVWRNSVAELPALKKRIRAEAEARIAEETEARRKEAAIAIQFALDAGASKAALRRVTTKDYRDFEGYVELAQQVTAEGAVSE